MEVPEGILYMDYNMPLACYPWSLLIYYLLKFLNTSFTIIPPAKVGGIPFRTSSYYSTSSIYSLKEAYGEGLLKQ